jgi:hypothetical protein
MKATGDLPPAWRYYNGNVMNNLDAIEGSVKSILEKLHGVWIDSHLDDSEYIRNTRAVIEATDRFIQENREITSDPDILALVLRQYAKELWLTHKTTVEKPFAGDSDDNGDYNEYCFDYIYERGVYPP